MLTKAQLKKKSKTEKISAKRKEYICKGKISYY